MDVRILGAIIALVCVVIVASRLFIFFFGFAGEYALYLTMFILIAVGTVVVFMIKKVKRDMDWHQE